MVPEDISFYIEIILMAFAILSVIAILTSYTWIIKDICCPTQPTKSKKRVIASTNLKSQNKCKSSLSFSFIIEFFDICKSILILFMHSQK